MKLQRPTGATLSTTTSIQHCARDFFLKSKSTAYKITSAIMSKFGINKNEVYIVIANLPENFLDAKIELNKIMYLWSNDPATSPNVLDNISTTSITSIVEAVAMNRNTSKRLYSV